MWDSIPGPWDHDPSRRQTPNHPSHPGAREATILTRVPRGCCCIGSTEERSPEPNYMSGARRKFTCFADTRCFQGGYSEVGDKSVYRRIRMLDKDFQLCPSSECEKEITVEPAPYIPAAGPQSGEEAFSRAPVRSESDQESSQTQESEEICLEEKTLVPLQAPKLFSGVEPACKSNQFLGPEGNVDIELIDKNANRYSVHFPTAGFYLWPATHLGFSVTAAVTVRIAFDSWGQHLDLKLQHEEQWMVAGPLFEVSVEPEGVITEIHLPHIISLPANEVDISWFRVAHFKDEGMVLEPPARVKPFCAVLENPSFSLMGILLRLASGTSVSVPITSTVLIYYHFHPEDSKFHLYLIPSDSLLMKAIDDEEAKFHGVRLQTSPPVDPLNFGSRYIVSSSPQLEIMPKESWRNPGVAFMKEYRRQLQARLGDPNGVLDDLQDSEVFTEEEKELVQQLPTQRRKNETLLTMVEKKGPQALEILFRSLNQRDPYLMSYLSQQSLQ